MGPPRNRTQAWTQKTLVLAQHRGPSRNRTKPLTQKTPFPDSNSGLDTKNPSSGPAHGPLSESNPGLDAKDSSSGPAPGPLSDICACWTSADPLEIIRRVRELPGCPPKESQMALKKIPSESDNCQNKLLLQKWGQNTKMTTEIKRRYPNRTATKTDPKVTR